MAQMYDVGTRAWQPDPTEGWVASEVEKREVNGDKVKLLFRLANGDVSVPPFIRCSRSFLAGWAVLQW